MKNLPLELKYTDKKFNTLEEYFPNIKHKINNTNCIVFFNLGSDAKEFLSNELKEYAVDTVTAYSFIKDLETRFKININVFDLEYFFKYNKERNNNSVIKLNDLTLVYTNLVNEYLRSITNYINR